MPAGLIVHALRLLLEYGSFQQVSAGIWVISTEQGVCWLHDAAVQSHVYILRRCYTACGWHTPMCMAWHISRPALLWSVKACSSQGNRVGTREQRSNVRGCPLTVIDSDRWSGLYQGTWRVHALRVGGCIACMKCVTHHRCTAEECPHVCPEQFCITCAWPDLQPA